MKKNIEPITIVMADDHELFRDGFISMCERIKEIKLLGVAGDGEELFELVRKTNPDVVITDIKMPKLDGIKLTEKLLEKYPEIGIIALSMFDDEHYIVDILDAGARGYLIKSAGKNEILEAVTTVFNGEIYYCKHTTLILAKLLAGRDTKIIKKMVPDFSSRERQVISYIAEGLASKEIAAKLDLKTRTVESYRENIMNKMNVNNTASLIIYAVKYGIHKI